MSMQSFGEYMHVHNVREIIFVHGTSVGNDPLDILNNDSIVKLIAHAENKFPDKFNGKKIIEYVQSKTKDFIDIRLKDVGNYTFDYVEQFGQLIGHGLCQNYKPFVWGSGNSHRARLEGTVALAKRLANRINDVEQPLIEDERILLIGHSHAGQLFALLTTFLENREPAAQLFRVLSDYPRLGDSELLTQNLEAIRKINLDFVTFGTPVRYKWAKYKKFRLLPVINHRSNSKFGLNAIINIEDGDYVQQWGTEGTNMPIIDSVEDELSSILGNQGFGLKTALQKASQSSSSNPVGRDEHQYWDGKIVAKNCLVDYGDRRPKSCTDLFYCIKKVFGHGIYTMKDKMVFNTQLIVDHFYS